MELRLRQRLLYGAVPPVLILVSLVDVLGWWILPPLVSSVVAGTLIARRVRSGRRIAVYSTVASVVLLLATVYVILLLFAAYS